MADLKRTPEHPGVYRAFLLRCWLEGGEQAANTVWRFSLEPVGGGKRRGFSDLEALVEFLRGAMSPREQSG